MRLVDEPIHPGLTAHEVALRQLRAASSYVFADAVSIERVPGISVAGVDGCLAWPPTPAQLQQLATLYAVDRTILVPAKHMTVHDEEAWDRYFDSQILDVVEHGLSLTTTDVVAIPTHLCIDTEGSADARMPSLAVDRSAADDDFNTIGSLLLVLPSAFSGGDLTFAFDGHARTVPLTPCEHTLRFAATYSDATVTSARITSGCRVTLVHRLVGVDVDDVRTSILPVTRQESVAAFTAIAAAPLPLIERVARPIQIPNLTFEALAPADAALVDVLLATHAYDVALVRFEAGNDDEDEADEEARDFRNIVASCVVHPSCDVPRAVADRVIGRSANAFLLDAPQATEYFVCAGHAIFFWPKASRAGVVGIDVALPLLTSALLDANAPRLGLDSAHDLVRGTIGVYQSMSRLYLDDETCEINYDIDYLPSDHETLMMDALVASRDVALADLFLGDALSASLSLETAARMVHQCLVAFGWPALAAAMRRLLKRWVRRSMRETASLLVSLAGAVDAGVCAPLRQPFACEFFKLCWHEVLAHEDKWSKNSIDENLLIMEWYLDDVASLDTDNHWLGHRLPPALVSVVDSFLYHRCRATYTLLTLRTDDVVWQLEHVPLCLLQALEVQPAITQRPYLDALVHVIDRHDMDDLLEWDDALSVTGGYSLLVCMNRLGRCDETFLAKMRILCSFRTIMAISQLVTQEPVTPLTAEILTSFLVDDATDVIDEALENDVIVRLAIATIDALVVLAPEKVPDFMTHWVCTVNSLDANRRKLYPIVRALAQKFALVPVFAKMTVLLATFCRTVFTASGIRPELLPTVVADFVLGDVPLDPTHCSQCMDAAIFLKNGVAIHFQRNTRICADIRALTNAHADRLTLQCSDWSDAYELRKVPGQATENERIQYIRAHGDQARDITCVATLDTLIAALTASESGDQTCASRPHKRHRSDGA